MQSSPMISGMPRRVFVFTVSTARGRSAGEVCRIEPTCLLTIRSSRSPLRASSCIIWPTFSSRVMRPSKSAMRSSAGRLGFLYGRSVVLVMDCSLSSLKRCPLITTWYFTMIQVISQVAAAHVAHIAGIACMAGFAMIRRGAASVPRVYAVGWCLGPGDCRQGPVFP